LGYVHCESSNSSQSQFLKNPRDNEYEGNAHEDPEQIVSQYHKKQVRNED